MLLLALACDLEADMVCEDRESTVTEVVFDPACERALGLEPG